MNLDQKLRTMLRERAEGVAAAPVVPDSTIRRVQMRKTLMAGRVAVAVLAVAVTGAFMRSVIWTDAAPVPPADVNPGPSEPTPRETPESPEDPAEAIELLDDVTFREVKPWNEHIEWMLISGTGGPESLLLLDDAQLLVIADPAPAKAVDSQKADCPRGRATVVSAEAFARAVQAHPGLVATDPVAERIAGVDALRLDVSPAERAYGCNGAGSVFKGRQERDLGVPVLMGTRETYFGPPVDPFVVPDGMKMRLYLLDIPRGTARTLAIAIAAAQDDFNAAVRAARPVLDSIEFQPDSQGKD